MNALWVVPAVVVLAGAAGIALVFRQLRGALADLRLQLVRLDEVRTAVAGVRTEAARSREAIARLRRR